MRPLCTAAFLFLVAHQVALAGPQAPGVIETTIEAVSADPRAYDGKLLQLRGLVDDCEWMCGLFSVEPGTMPASLTTPLLGMQLSDNGLVNELMREIYRFSEITAIGRFDAKCLGPRVLCTDNATSFYVDHVVIVHKRWPGAQWRLPPIAKGPESRWPLASQADTRAIASAYVEALPLAERAETLEPYAAFLVPPRRRGVVRPPKTEPPPAAQLCFCREVSCEGQWPANPRDALNTPNNPYWCVKAEKVDGKWRVPLQ